jgi:sigma-B regulation protein RsbU (phosphoserine phosphatase)
MFGKQRFREIIREHAHLSAKEILDRVYSALDAFTLGRKKDDDVTLVVIKISAPSAAKENWQI